MNIPLTVVGAMLTASIGLAQSNPTYVQFSPSTTKGALYRPDSGPPPRVGVVLTHRTGNYYPGQPTTGVLYGEAIGTGWLSSQQKIDEGHRHYVAEGWNKLRIVARGPRIQTFVNGHLIEDLTNEEVYKTHAKGFIGLQVHGISERELSLPVHAGSGITKSQPLIVKWRNIRVRPLSAND